MSSVTAEMGMAGSLGVRVVRRVKKPSLWWKVRHFLAYRWRELPLDAFLAAWPLVKRLIPGLTVMHSETRLRVLHADGTVTDYGLVSRHLITTAGKNYVAACFNNTNEPENLKYHGFGTGTTAAAIGDTALQTEFTTQYATDNVRPTGSQAASTNTYTTVATFSPDTGGTLAVTEFGLLSQAATGGGTLFDHIIFSAVNLTAGSDSLQSSYTLSLS